MKFFWKTKKKIKVTLLMTFYNEMHYLPGWFANVRNNTEHIVLLNDGSTDGSALYAAQQPETTLLLQNYSKEKKWDEPLNKKKLFTAGLLTNPDWFLVIDADERMGQQFWLNLNQLLKYAHKLERIVGFLLYLPE
jgi:glycosyltransferase involved in cell wall biosynthesis